MAAILKRETFSTNRLMEFFTEKELTMQIGHGRRQWGLALIKELIDNALDAAEAAGVAPSIEVEVLSDGMTIKDNGPGIAPDTVAGSLDYAVRVSDKNYFVSPTRGQLGNALKTVWAAPFVAEGSTQATIESRGERHEITVSLDRINQCPDIRRVVSESDVQTGTIVTVHWPNLAGYLGYDETAEM